MRTPRSSKGWCDGLRSSHQLGSELSLESWFLTPGWEPFPCAIPPLQPTGTQRCHPGPWLIGSPPISGTFTSALCSKPLPLPEFHCSPNQTTNQPTHPKKQPAFSACCHGKGAVEPPCTKMLGLPVPLVVPPRRECLPGVSAGVPQPVSPQTRQGRGARKDPVGAEVWAKLSHR